MTSTIPLRFIQMALRGKVLAVVPAPNTGNVRFFVLLGI